MVTMSQKEFQRVRVIENAAGGRLSVREASRLLQLSERQVQRLKRRYQPDSIAWVQHRNRGRSTSWALPLPQKQLILNLARVKYQGFNDSHLAEKLRADENLAVSRETVRRLLRAAKLASPQKRRPRQYRSRRPPPPRSLPTRSRKYSRLSPRSRLHDHHSWCPAQPLPRPPLHLPAQRSPLDPRRTTRRKTSSYPAGAGAGGARHRADPRLLSPSQGPHRTRLAPLPGPSGQRTAPRPRHHLAPSQCRTRPVLCRLQPTLCSSRHPSRFRLPLPAAPLRSRPLPGLALSTRRGCRPHRNLRRAGHRPAPLARPSRLCRRNRRARASLGWHAARLSRRSATSRSASATPRTRRAPS